MNATQQLHALGQSLWLDHITRSQREGTAAFARSWKGLMRRIASKRGLS